MNTPVSFELSKLLKEKGFDYHGFRSGMRSIYLKEK